MAAFLGGWEDEVEAAIQDICCKDDAGFYLRDIDYYPDAIDARLDRLRKITEGKDVCIYGAGPSIEKIAKEKNIKLLYKGSGYILIDGNFSDNDYIITTRIPENLNNQKVKILN